MERQKNEQNYDLAGGGGFLKVAANSFCFKGENLAGTVQVTGKRRKGV